MAAAAFNGTRGTAIASAPARFVDTLASEWTKLTSLRSTYVTLAVGLILALSFTALFGVVIGNEWDGMSAEDRAEFHPALFALFGYLFSQIAFAVVGVNAVASEYSSGMMHLTLAATPRRGRVLLAKLLVVIFVTLIAGFVTAFGMFFLGQAIFSQYGTPTTTLADWDSLRAVLAVGFMLPVLPILGATLAVLLRSVAGAITVVLALTFAPQFFGDLLPEWWQDNVVSLLPGPASETVMVGHLLDDPGPVGAGLAAAAIIAWLVVASVSAYAVLMRRDG